MAQPSLISFWSDRPGAGRRTVARALAQHWMQRGQETLVIEANNSTAAPAGSKPGPSVVDRNTTGSRLMDRQDDGFSPSHDPAVWVPRFRSLAPVMLCNFLSGSRGSHACLKLPRLPESVLLRELLGLVTQAYPWTLLIGPRELSVDVLPVVDASTHLLWVSSPVGGQAAIGPDPSGFQGFLDQLTKFHFPHAFADAVLNRFSEAISPPMELAPGKRALALVSEDSSGGFHFQKDIQRLAQAVEEKTRLGEAAEDQ